MLLLPPAEVLAQLTFKTNNGAITITGYTGNPAMLNIPSTTNGYQVISIGAKAFQNCTSLINVTIGTNITSIGDLAFANCTSLTAITVNSNNPSYTSVAGVLFDERQTTLIQCPGAIAGSYAIPNSITNIGHGAFSGCANLTNVTIGINVSSIGSTAFFGCASLANFMIGSSVTSIGGSAFSGCTSLTNVTIGTNVTSIGVNAFYDCPSLMTIMVNSNNSAYSSVAGVLFDKNQTTLIAYPETKAGSYAIPDSVTNIEANAFADCMNLQNVTIPNSVISIGGGAFRFCVSLTRVTIPDNVTSIGFIAFNNCISLTNITIPNSVTSIGIQAFYFCLSLTSVTIPSSVTNIGSLAFANCSNLTGVYFQGNAPTPTNDSSVFSDDNNGIVYYLPATTGWSTTFDSLPTMLWNPQAQKDSRFGVQNDQFGFNITGGSNLVIVVEACTNLPNPVWQPVQTKTLAGGSSYFSDSQWTNYSGRYYRIRSP